MPFIARQGALLHAASQGPSTIIPSRVHETSTLALKCLVEDAVDDGGLLGCASAEIPSRGVEGGVAEEGLDLSDVSTAFAQSGGVGVAEPMGAQAGKRQAHAVRLADAVFRNDLYRLARDVSWGDDWPAAGFQPSAVTNSS